jgi:chromosome segregation ATPase
MQQTQCHPHCATSSSEPPTRLVHLDQHRARRLEADVNEVRAQLHALERSRVQAELQTGSLWRELSALQRELRGCRERLSRCLGDTEVGV